jgi:hypothetical protein
LGKFQPEQSEPTREASLAAFRKSRMLIYADVPTHRPTRFLKALRKRRNAGWCLWIVSRQVHRHADPSDACRLLRRAPRAAMRLRCLAR